FTPQGRIDLSVEISAETGDAVFTVTDTGIGVPPEKAETIFKRFERLNPEIEGSGLGLSVCRLVCHTLDATVTLDTSYAGPGSRFIFRIHPHE
ncbi:MAG: two-component sensor histidine kinase, partial [Muribaculaceae bacterium]|nr:two-component sensor histidine kinase [Muribaculaceae bacterium]